YPGRSLDRPRGSWPGHGTGDAGLGLRGMPPVGVSAPVPRKRVEQPSGPSLFRGPGVQADLDRDDAGPVARSVEHVLVAKGRLVRDYRMLARSRATRSD